MFADAHVLYYARFVSTQTIVLTEMDTRKVPYYDVKAKGARKKRVRSFCLSKCGRDRVSGIYVSFMNDFELLLTLSLFSLYTTAYM